MIKIDNRIKPFVNEIFMLESKEAANHNLPFYADGFPGLMYSETNKEIILLPLGKMLPPLFLYGQTIEPISLEIDGEYRIIVFQLYPFATRLLLGINPQDINDNCYDLCEMQEINTNKTIRELRNSVPENQFEILTSYILKLIKKATDNGDNTIKLAISTIIDAKGTIPIKQLREQLFISERTFERRFKKEIGVTPKQFARIIQFSFSLDQLKESDYNKLTHVAYENGFTDQSHFIKTFKQFTGATPKELLTKIS